MHYPSDFMFIIRASCMNNFHQWRVRSVCHVDVLVVYVYIVQLSTIHSLFVHYFSQFGYVEHSMSD